MSTAKVPIKTIDHKPKSISFEVTTTEEDFKKVQEVVVKKFSLVRVFGNTPKQEPSSVDLYRYGVGTKMFFIFIRNEGKFKINFMHSEPSDSAELRIVEEGISNISIPVAVAG